MSNLNGLRSTVVEAAVDACWRQWDVLGAMADSGRQPEAIVDPEALLLLSFSLSRFEHRLSDMTGWWAQVGSQLTSLQRLLSLADRFPGAEDGLAAFAAAAFGAGDRRWRRHAAPDYQNHGRALKGPESPNLFSPVAMLLRVRAGIGLGAKADILAFLICTSPREATIAEISDATGYSTQAIRVATADLLAARFAFEVDEGPTRISVHADAWSQLLLDREPDGNAMWPEWRHWIDVFALLSESVRWMDEPQPTSDYVQSSRARDLLERHSRAVAINRIRVADPKGFKGQDFLPVFHDSLVSVTRWVDRNL